MDPTRSPTGHDELIGPIVELADRFVAMVRRLDADRAVPGSAWTVGDTVAHLATGIEAYGRYLTGDPTPLIDLSDVPGGSIAASNARTLADLGDRDVRGLTDRFRHRLADVLVQARTMGLDDPVTWHGREEPLRVVLAVMLAEIAIHGSDVAAGSGTPWPITRPVATTIIANIAPLLPVLVDPVATRDVDAVVRVRLRGGPQLRLAFRHGTLHVGDGAARRPDVTVSADPVAFLLVAYGRRSQWRAIARGQLVAWGRRPWIALRLTSYLVPP
jgi:uncharacterized protein (TIGR03083 family)